MLVLDVAVFLCEEKSHYYNISFGSIIGVLLAEKLLCGLSELALSPPELVVA